MRMGCFEGRRGGPMSCADFKLCQSIKSMKWPSYYMPFKIPYYMSLRPEVAHVEINFKGDMLR